MRAESTQLTVNLDTETAHSTISNDALNRKCPFHRPFKVTKKVVRALLVPLALLSQSTASIWLYVRRVNRGSDELYDHRVLQLALLGLSVSVKTIIHVLFEPRYPLQRRSRDPKVRWVLFLRPDKIAREQQEGASVDSEARSDGDGDNTKFSNQTGSTIAVTQFTDIIFEWVYLYSLFSLSQRLGLVGKSSFTSINEILIPAWEAFSILFPVFWYILPWLVCMARPGAPAPSHGKDIK